MKRISDSKTEMEDVLLRELGKSAFPDRERFHRNFLERLRKERVRPIQEEDRSVSWQNVFWGRFAYAALVLIVITASGTYWYVSNTKPIAKVAVTLGEITTSNASSQNDSVYKGGIVQSASTGQASLLLADLSLIRLDTQSSVKLVKARRIQLLEGRLYADVTHTPKEDRFQIDANDVSVVVTGTSFEVDSRNDQTTVTVFDGSVQVEWSESSQTLNKGDSLTIAKNDKNPQIRPARSDSPDWISKLRSAEAINPIIRSMQVHLPSRSHDNPKKP